MFGKIKKVIDKISWTIIGNVAVAVLVMCFYQLVWTLIEVRDLRKEISVLTGNNVNLFTKVSSLIDERDLYKGSLIVAREEIILASADIDTKIKNQLIGKPIPMAIPNKNPLNVKKPIRGTWKGQIGLDKFGHAQFSSWEYGFRAAGLTLRSYAMTHKIDTLEGVVHRFAEGNREAYIKFLCEKLDIKRDTKFNLMVRLPELLQAMTRFESSVVFPKRYFAPYDIPVAMIAATK